jgi:hypothetical protein
MTYSRLTGAFFLRAIEAQRWWILARFCLLWSKAVVRTADLQYQKIHPEKYLHEESPSQTKPERKQIS